MKKILIATEAHKNTTKKLTKCIKNTRQSTLIYQSNKHRANKNKEIKELNVNV